MSRAIGFTAVCLACWLSVTQLHAQDWPQWRGPNRDGTTTGFESPKSWPEELTKKWSVTVGDGVSTPALLGNQLYVFAREGGDEILRCLDTSSGEMVWEDKYAADGVGGPASGFAGPRASPALADGKVVTLGVHGMVSCLNAQTGKVLWRKNDFPGSEPRFATSSSPLIVNGNCIVQTGGESGGAIVAYKLDTGDQVWKWDGDGASYASPVLMALDGTETIVTPTSRNLVVVRTSDGKFLWGGAYAQGRYNATTPLVSGQTVIYAGPGQGTTAEKFLVNGDEVTSEIVWENGDNSLMFNTPVMRDGVFYGLSSTNALFCVNAADGTTLWSASPAGDAPAQEGGGGRRGRGGGRGGYGSIVDAGSVLFALTPDGQLTVFEPNKEAFKKLASYEVGAQGCYAHPLIAKQQIIIKDQNDVTLWAIQ